MALTNILIELHLKRGVAISCGNVPLYKRVLGHSRVAGAHEHDGGVEIE